MFKISLTAYCRCASVLHVGIWMDKGRKVIVSIILSVLFLRQIHYSIDSGA